MKIKTMILKDFLKKVKMQDTHTNTEALFVFGEEGLIVNTMSADNTVMCNALLLKSAFIEYEAINEVPMQKIDVFIKFLDSFGDETEIKVYEGIIELIGVGDERKKIRQIPLIDKSILELEKIKIMKDAPLDDAFSTTATVIKSFISDATDLGKDIQIDFITEPNKITMRTANDLKMLVTDTIQSVGVKGGVQTRVRLPFIDAVANLTGNITLHLRTNYPLKLVETTDVSKIIIAVAPVEIDKKE